MNLFQEHAASSRSVRRPQLTPARIEGLKMLADHMRPLAAARAGRHGLFQLRSEDAKKVRNAIRYADALAKWQKERATQ